MKDSRSLILKHVLPLVPFDGWSDYTLTQAAKSAGMDVQAVKLAFPGGPVDCIDYFFAAEDEALAIEFSTEKLAEKRVPDRITTLVLAKLSQFTPHREAVRRAVATYALPWNALRATRTLYHTIDLMWQLAGDTSLDFNFYSKRATLAAVYSSTLLFWLNDDSESFVATKGFLERRLAGVAAFGKWKQEFTRKFRVS